MTVSHSQFTNDTKTVSKKGSSMSQKVQHTRITLRIPQPIQDKAKAKAGAQHISLNSFIVRAVERAIAQKGQQQ